MANILILTLDRQGANHNQWISPLSSEHNVFIDDALLFPPNFFNKNKAEMAIIETDATSADLTPVLPLIRSGLKILILGKNWPEEEQIHAFIAGCYGYCEVDVAAELLPKAVNSILKGDVWMPRQLIPKVIDMLAKLSLPVNQAYKPSGEKKKALDILTHREIDVAKMLSEGLSNKSIASMLNISERTVKAHLTSIFQKLEVQDRLQLALFLKDIN
ncbi:MAG: LuxR C-terminal-related transcriptional regulator [Methylomicrobium sp.]